MPNQASPTVGCPTCGGPLSGEATEWVCAVGHRFTFPALADDQAAAVVRALWYALRALEDRAISSNFAAADYDKAGLDRQADRLRAQQVQDLAMVNQLHDLLRHVHSVDHGRNGEADTISHEEKPGQGSHN